MYKPTVFIASSSEGVRYARMLQQQLEAMAVVTVWAEGAFQPGRTVIESLYDIAARTDFGVVIMTPDDVLTSRDGLAVPRSNLLFELGLLVGHLGPSRTFIVADPARAAIPSDLAGVSFVPFRSDDPVAAAATLAQAAAVIRRTATTLQRRSERPIEFHSCFISYSWKDKDFASRLFEDLEAVGVSCWLDVRDLVTGEPLAEQIDRAIQIHEKVLLLLSKSTLQSRWVELEVQHSIDRERELRKTILFPLALDTKVFAPSEWAPLVTLKERYILDFSGWGKEDSYRRSFKRLVRDLAISASVESEDAR
jgi:hypothetical protein